MANTTKAQRKAFEAAKAAKAADKAPKAPKAADKATDGEGTPLPTKAGALVEWLAVAVTLQAYAYCSGQGHTSRAQAYSGYRPHHKADIARALDALSSPVHGDGGTSSNPGGRIKASNATTSNGAALGVTGCITLGNGRGPGNVDSIAQGRDNVLARFGDSTVDSGATVAQLVHGKKRMLALTIADCTDLADLAASCYVTARGGDAIEQAKAAGIRAFGIQALACGEAWARALALDDARRDAYRS